MASEKPLVLVASGEAAEIVTAAGGIVVSPGDRAGLTRALKQLLETGDRGRELGAKLRRAAVERYDRMNICDRFIAELERNVA
jgi:glycosyltransferase involved in cell wall biosynthesis